MTVGTLLVIVLIVLLIGSLPRWRHSRRWGYGPSGGLGLVLVIPAHSCANRQVVNQAFRLQGRACWHS